jgi:hypothetical protein
MNNIYKLHLIKIFFKPSYTDILKILEKELFYSVKGHFKVLWLFLDKNFYVKSCKSFLYAYFLENKFSTKFPVCLCRLVLDHL